MEAANRPMLKRALQLLTLTALVNLVFQLWPRTGGELIPVTDSEGKWGYLDDGGRVRITGAQVPEEELLYRVLDKDGKLIWANTWLRKTTKARLYLFATVLPLLIVMWMSRRRRKMQLERT